MRQSLCTFFSFLIAITAFNFSYSQHPSQGVYFTSADVSLILSDRSCAAVRFYNAIDANGHFSAFAVGIDHKGKELNGGAFGSSKYLMAFDFSQGRSAMLTKNQAKEMCNEVTNSGNASFSASFSAEELNAMFVFEGTTGIEIAETYSGEDRSFSAQAVQYKSGEMNASPGSFPIPAGEPCPTSCGEASNYLNR